MYISQSRKEKPRTSAEPRNSDRRTRSHKRTGKKLKGGSENKSVFHKGQHNQKANIPRSPSASHGLKHLNQPIII